MKYVIMADSSIGFETPRQLTLINNEPIIKRTIRLLKENDIKDIIITSHDKRFDNLGVERYEPKNNYYIPDYSNYKNNKGYWLNAFTIELLNQPICFLFGDVYYSDNAIKTIVETKTKDTLFFCSYQNTNDKYIKHHDEPLAYKVVDYKLFKKHIEIVKKAKDEDKCCREPIVWELYRSINNQDINTHVMTKNYVAINDESCDIDAISDIIRLEIKLGGNDMFKCEALEDFTLSRFNEIKNLTRHDENKKENGWLYKGDIFECDKELANYLNGENKYKKSFVKVIEVIPLKIEAEKVISITPTNDVKDEDIIESVEIVKTNRKKKKSKK